MSAYPPIEFNARPRQFYPRRKLASGSAPAVERILYECPPDRTAVVQHLQVASTHTGAETFTIWHVRAGETTALGNALYYDYSLSAKSYLHEEGAIYMLPGERLVYKAGSADRITVSVFGEET